MSAKELVEQVLRTLPDEASMEDIHYSMYVAELLNRRGAATSAAISGGIDEGIRAGKLLPHDVVVQRMSRWLRK